MIGAYAYSPGIWPPLTGAILLAALGLFSWWRRSVPAALPLALCSLFGVLWLLGLAFGAAAVAPTALVAWHKFQAIWQMPAAIAMTCFALEYTFPGRWLTRRNLTLFALPALLALLLIVIHDAQLMWRRLELAPGAAPARQFAAPGAILMAYGVGLGLINGAAFIWLFVRSPQHRWPAAVMLFGEIVGRGLYLLDIFQAPWQTRLDPVVAGLVLIWATYAIALFGFRIFDPLPAAQAIAIEQMQDGMVVFDARWRVVSLNRAAATILSISAARVRGMLLTEILPAHCDEVTYLAASETASTEISLETGAGVHHYSLEFTPLQDFRSASVGYLLLMHDVTEQHRTQAALLEQQRALAAMQERELVARELHDGLGGVLGYVKMQAQAARLLLARDHKAEADAQLARLVAVAQDAHADVREYIFEASTASPIEQGLGASLQQYLQRFSQIHQIRTELNMPPEMATGLFEPTVAVQLLRIIQEALTNARKHTHASQVRVSLAIRDDFAEIIITDNGQGFDPAMARSDGFGLRFMRERAQEVGGNLQVRSAPGQGAQVVVTAPLRKNDSL